VITKHLLHDSQAFRSAKATYWQDTDYHTYYVRKPDQYPCIAIEVSEPRGELGTVSTIEEYVYLTDFKP
jgi:hypothetical protein